MVTFHSSETAQFVNNQGCHGWEKTDFGKISTQHYTLIIIQASLSY